MLITHTSAPDLTETRSGFCSSPKPAPIDSSTVRRPDMASHQICSGTCWPASAQGCAGEAHRLPHLWFHISRRACHRAQAWVLGTITCLVKLSTCCCSHCEPWGYTQTKSAHVCKVLTLPTQQLFRRTSIFRTIPSQGATSEGVHTLQCLDMLFIWNLPESFWGCLDPRCDRHRLNMSSEIAAPDAGIAHS